jgi:hypothetical protein
MVAVPPNLLAEPEENEGSPVCTSGDARLIGPDLLEKRNRFSMLENRPHFVVNNWPVLDEPLQKRIASIVVNRRIGNRRPVQVKWAFIVIAGPAAINAKDLIRILIRNAVHSDHCRHRRRVSHLAIEPIEDKQERVREKQFDRYRQQANQEAPRSIQRLAEAQKDTVSVSAAPGVMPFAGACASANRGLLPGLKEASRPRRPATALRRDSSARQ